MTDPRETLEQGPPHMKPGLDDLSGMLAGAQAGVDDAIERVHERGLPVFVADDKAVYAIYPDGRKVAVERLRPTVAPNPRAA